MVIEPRQLVASLLVPLSLLVLPTEALAQTGTSNLLSMHSRLPGAAQGVSLPVPAEDRASVSVGPSTWEARLAQSGSSRDSLKNGIIIGAVIGAAGLGTFGGLLCKALQAPGEPSCLGDTLRIAAVGAAIGAGAGLALDAALSRQAGLRVSVGFKF
jgi:hypothetical protein